MIVYSHLAVYNCFQMKKQNLNLTTSPQKDFKELIFSIQSKLELIASENFDKSQKEPFTRSMPAPMRQHQSPNKSYLQLQDLTTPSPGPSPSPVMQKLDQIQQQYLSQITSLNHKLAMLQTENQELKAENSDLHDSVTRLQRELELIEESNVKILERRVEEIQNNLMHKLREQIEEEISNYIVELEQMRRDIAAQRKSNKQLQNQKQVLTSQRNNFQFLYREILEKYKQLLQIDIQSYEKDSKIKAVSKSQYQNLQHLNEPLQIKRIKQSRQSKKRRSKHVKAQQMSKQQLIPFLTKGIEELKQKLKLK